ncbi:hypothetical protein LCM10_12165 [Rossellomorea aquimaris]|uniref:hypothetical protein n=1 Tax=Rossellomorea aquimaris TaxID=189382 RepID=UPI001CD78AF9|nr:hypothetical protein [Rossellomorea aquimaris]MCA1055742.1 hypothetical protein [Rossellomorea aquimaris]
MNGIFLLILVPFFIIFISILMTNPSKRTNRDGGHTVLYGDGYDGTDHCGGFDGGSSGGDGGCGGGE